MARIFPSVKVKDGLYNNTGGKFVLPSGLGSGTLAETTLINRLISKPSVITTRTGTLDDDNDITTSSTVYNSTGGTSGRGQITATLLVTGVLTLSDVTLVNGDRILLIGETDPESKGIWVVTISGTALTLDRPTDYDQDNEIQSGNQVYTEEGTNATRTYTLTTVNPIIIGGASGTALVYEDVAHYNTRPDNGRESSPANISLAFATPLVFADIIDLSQAVSQSPGRPSQHLIVFNTSVSTSVSASRVIFILNIDGVDIPETEVETYLIEGSNATPTEDSKTNNISMVYLSNELAHGVIMKVRWTTSVAATAMVHSYQFFTVAV